MGSKGALPRFDPGNAIKAALEILKEADAPFALAGCLAVWQHVPAEHQRFTKDVDFAVPHEHMAKVVEAAGSRGYRPEELPIGGFRIMVQDVPVDFIDRHPEFPGLFDQAVRNAGEADFGFAVPVVGRDHLVAMKVIPSSEKDDRDVEALLGTVPKEHYGVLRGVVVSHVGHAAGYHLDRIARRMGHPAAPPKRKC